MNRFLKKRSLSKTVGSMAIGIAVLFSACHRPIPKEEPVLSEEKLRLILKDIHLAESLLTEEVDRRIKDSLARVYYHQIFRLHEVDPEDFDQSMHAYFTDPWALDSLYRDVMKELDLEKKEVVDKARQSAGDKRDPMPQ